MADTKTTTWTCDGCGKRDTGAADWSIVVAVGGLYRDYCPECAEIVKRGKAAVQSLSPVEVEGRRPGRMAP